MSSRGPLIARPLPHQSPSAHGRIVRSINSLSKRPRSPEAAPDARTKRVKSLSQTTPSRAAAAAHDPRFQEREERRAEKEAQKEAQKEEFRIKYRKAFPSWVFHFDADVPAGSALDRLQTEIEALGGRVDDFFSAEVTHLITNAPLPTTPVPTSSTSTVENKENASRSRSALSRTFSHPKSPYNGKSRAVEEESHYKPNTVLSKALEFGLKVWNVSKLDSVLDRTLFSEERDQLLYATKAAHARPPNPSLTTLLAAERMHGTSERDPTQKRHDFRYFSKNSYFVLIEDMRQELATIAAVEYPITKGKNGEERGQWPVLYCHPRARGPFIEFDEREERRYERQEKALKQREMEKEKAKARYIASIQRKRAKAQEEQKRHGDLRRTVSLSNLQREESIPEVTVEGDVIGALESAHASGYLASGTYIAASGNSFSVASTTGTGTTSTAGSLSGRPLPANLRGKLQQEVLTKRRISNLVDGEAGPSQSGVMGPPPAIPDRRKALLRKSRSTNTLRLPTRQEGFKPGFCESCRVKFDDFAHHIKSKRHRKFALDDANFAQLDSVLARMRRRTVEEVAAERELWESGADNERDAEQEAEYGYESEVYDGHALHDDEDEDTVELEG